MGAAVLESDGSTRSASADAGGFGVVFRGTIGGGLREDFAEFGLAVLEDALDVGADEELVDKCAAGDGVVHDVFAEGAAIAFGKAVFVNPLPVGAAELLVDEAVGRVPIADFGTPADGDAVEFDAVVDESAGAHFDFALGEDAKVDPGRRDGTEVAGVGEEGEDGVEGMRQPEFGFELMDLHGLRRDALASFVHVLYTFRRPFPVESDVTHLACLAGKFDSCTLRSREIRGGTCRLIPPRIDREFALTNTMARHYAWKTALANWFDTAPNQGASAEELDRIDWFRCIPYVGMHLTCFGVFWVGVSWVALAVAAGMYAVHMFAITGFYHRYFAHRAFKTSRWFQFVMAAVGASSVQRDALWWAAHHRHHHAVSEKPEDPHSPVQHGFWRSHSGWFMTLRHFPTHFQNIKDFARFPELRFLNRYDVAAPVALAVALFGLGALLMRVAPEWGTSGAQMLIWGFFVSTVCVYHGTFTINSLSHVWGRKRFDTGDESRNNWVLALVTFGEGWHNNHHHYPSAARQGFYWWELDLTYYGLRVLAALGLIWDLRPVPAVVLTNRRVDTKVGEAVARGSG